MVGLVSARRAAGGEVVALRLDPIDGKADRDTIATALDELEESAAAAGLLYVDVALQLALARHLASVVTAVRFDSELSIAQVYAIRELRLAVTDLRQLVVGYAR